MSPEVSRFDALNQGKASAHRRVMSSLYSQEKSYKELEKSVKRKKWINASMMEHRDRQRQYANCKSKLKIQIMKDIVSLDFN
jgi:alpha-D-ribose 1-methylphosphonate 5-triphosphate diphosphatase PhnM